MFVFRVKIRSLNIGNFIYFIGEAILGQIVYFLEIFGIPYFYISPSIGHSHPTTILTKTNTKNASLKYRKNMQIFSIYTPNSRSIITSRGKCFFLGMEFYFVN